jgi:nucleoside-triphosphatase THEP1
LETRKLWSDLANEFLAREGFQERITEKSFADLGINLEASKHQGCYADIIGTDSRIVQENLEISKRNEEKILRDPSIILDYINEKKSVFNQKDILNEISKRVFEEKSISTVFEKVLEEAIYVGESVKGELLYTGERYQKLESDVLFKFDIISSQEAKTICRKEVISSVLENYDYLSQEQKTAVEGLCGNSNIGVLLGRAGAGKTTTMKAVSDVYKNSGAWVVGMSISALASENLGKDAEIESATIAAWSHRWRSYELAKESFLSFDSVVTDGILKQLDWYNDLQGNVRYQLKSGDIIIVDEAGMVGTKEWKTILDAAEKFGAKVIAVGDDNQFKPISAGDCLRHFLRQVTNLDRAQSDGSATIAFDTSVSDISVSDTSVSGKPRSNVLELREIRRQKEEWQREASVDFSRLNVGEALVRYEEHGRIHAIDEADLYSRIAERYLEIEKLGTSAILCSTNGECAAINNKIRSLKKERGEIGEDIISLNGRNFAEHDRIMFLKNDMSLGIKNGQCATVQGKCSFEGAKVDMLTVHLEDGRQLEINVAEYSNVDHAYAITLHKSQGRTYDNTVLTVTKQGVMDVKSMYVGMTRHRDNVDVYYRKSDFSSFKDFVKGVSRNISKDLLADYRLENADNPHKTLVYEYQNLRLELSALLKDINCGEGTWKEYNDLKASKVNLEKEILGNYESCKLYLDQLGITKERLEESTGLKQRAMTRVEQTARNTVLTYPDVVMSPEDKRIVINALISDLAESMSINKLSPKLFEDRQSVNRAEKTEFSGTEFSGTEIFAKLEAAKLTKKEAFQYTGSTFAERRILAQTASYYKEWVETHTQKYGYAPHISRPMLVAYCGENNLKLHILGDYVTNEYASMLVHQKIKEKAPEESGLEISEAAAKQALCFKALKDVSGIRELTPEAIKKLHNKAEAISSHLTKENIHVLDDKNFTLLAYEKIGGKEMENAFSKTNIEHLIKLNHKDMTRQNEFSREKSCLEINKVHNFEISR